jgi:hypothetical protein
MNEQGSRPSRRSALAPQALRYNCLTYAPCPWLLQFHQFEALRGYSSEGGDPACPGRKRDNIKLVRLLKTRLRRCAARWRCSRSLVATCRSRPIMPCSARSNGHGASVRSRCWRRMIRLGWGVIVCWTISAV